MMFLGIAFVIAAVVGGIVRAVSSGESRQPLVLALCGVVLAAVLSLIDAVERIEDGFGIGAVAQGAIGPLGNPFAILLAGFFGVIAGYFTTNAIIFRMNSWE